MQFLSKNHLNGCQIFGRFGDGSVFKNRIRTEFRFSAHPYFMVACHLD